MNTAPTTRPTTPLSAESRTTAPPVPRPTGTSLTAQFRNLAKDALVMWACVIPALFGFGLLFWFLINVVGIEQDSPDSIAVVPDVLVFIWTMYGFVMGITLTTSMTSANAAAGMTRRTQAATTWAYALIAVLSLWIFGGLLIVASQAITGAWSEWPLTTVDHPWLGMLAATLPIVAGTAAGIITGYAFKAWSWWTAILACLIPWNLAVLSLSWASWVGGSGRFGVDLTFGKVYGRGWGDTFDADMATGAATQIWPVVFLILGVIAIAALAVRLQSRIEIRKAA